MSWPKRVSFRLTTIVARIETFLEPTHCEAAYVKANTGVGLLSKEGQDGRS